MSVSNLINLVVRSYAALAVSISLTRLTYNEGRVQYWLLYTKL